MRCTTCRGQVFLNIARKAEVEQAQTLGAAADVEVCDLMCSGVIWGSVDDGAFEAVNRVVKHVAQR